MKRYHPFQNQVVWITGASSGIGEALAKAFSAEGARVILSARRLEKLEVVASRCPEETKIFPLDLTDQDALPLKAEVAQALFGKIDILVHNAGISQRSPALETSMEVTRRIFETNVFGVIALTRAVLPRMIERGEGRIVVISSVLGKFGAPTRSSYAASKHALHGYFDSLRAEVYDKGIRITLVCPGYVQTEISFHALEADGSPHGRLDPGQAKGISPERCAQKILQAIREGRDEVTIGGWETWGVIVKRFWPGLLHWILRRVVVD